MAFYKKAPELDGLQAYPETYLTPYCGLCRRIINLGDECHILSTDETGTVYMVQGHYTCSKDDLCCDPCHKSPEQIHNSCGLHSDCFALFKKHCQRSIEQVVLDRIWVEGVCQLPWPEVPCLWLDETDDLFSATGLNNVIDGTVQDELDPIRDLINGLKSLPQEILLIIYQKSADSLIWRYGTVLDFAHHVSSLDESEDIQPLPLNEVAAWERGSLPTTTTTTTHHELPVLRLDIDARGIRALERLPNRLLPSTERQDNHRFIVAHENEIDGITMHFKFGYAQLNLSKVRCDDLQVWDTPTPPDDSAYTLHADPGRGPRMSLCTIPLDGADGLTFFFEKGRPHGIHKHTPSDPCAVTTYTRLTMEKDLVGVYMPIAAGDRILAFGVRYEQGKTSVFKNRTCFIFRTELVGDVVVGAGIDGWYTDICLGSTANNNTSPMTIVYNARKMQPFSAIGGYTTNQPASTELAVPFCNLSRLNNPFRFANLSIAPLEDVVHVRICTDKEEQVFSGMILTYRNGGKRALGECNVDFDPVVDCANPAFICIRRTQYKKESRLYPGRTLEVKASTSSSHEHKKSKWNCLPLRGNLQIWFTGSRCDYTTV